MNTHRSLVQIRDVIDALNGVGFQKQIHLDMPAFGPHEVKAMLESILVDEQATEAEPSEAQELRELLQEKCGM